MDVEMAKHNYNKYRRNTKRKKFMTNPCAEIALGEYQQGTTFRVNTDGLYNISYSFNGDTIDSGEIGQATALARPGRTMHTISGSSSAGVEPAFSHAYRRGDESFQDTVNRVGQTVVPSGNRRSAALDLVPVDGGFTQRNNRARPYGTSILAGMDVEALRNSIGNGYSSIPREEESALRRELAQLYQSDGHYQVRGNAS